MESTVLLDALRESAHPLSGAPDDFDPLMERIGDARFVLLGAASHGAEEVHRARATITERLIREKGFTAVALEADGPDADRLRDFVRGASDEAAADAESALDSFRRFPAWVWRNREVLSFVRWLRAHNDESDKRARVGIYGLDHFGLRASMQTVLDHFREIDPAAGKKARERYGSFDHFANEARRSGLLRGLGLAATRERDIVEKLATRLGIEEDSKLGQSARARADEYYRAMFFADTSSWNLRDEHMASTLGDLMADLDRHEGRAKIVVWAHNAHVGDARATDRAAAGEHNLGQLVREQHGADAVLIGFTSYDGTVTASSAWDSPAERMRVRPALAASHEGLLHGARIGSSLIVFTPHALVTSLLRQPRLERAIGVVYVPETERPSHYMEARLSDQFDAVVHFDRTRAVEPLDKGPAWSRGETGPNPFDL